jgi:ATP-dependent RNA helicase RhlE
MSFETLGLRAELLRAVQTQGYTHATPVQQQAIPLILAGRDLLAGAQTGTGKTAAFTLPMLQKLAEADLGSKRRHPRALVLTPTRELAAQVAESVRSYGKNLSLHCTVVFGGVSINPQIDRLRRGTDVVVATPGRLLDHAQRGTVDLSKIEILVLDEADRMLDMGFIRDIRRLLNLMPAKRQNLLFSATFAEEIRKLAAQLLENPAEVQVTPKNATADRIDQLVYPLDKGRKREFLSHLIGQNNWRQVLVFTRTKHGANRLTKQLESDGLRAAAIHGNKSQGARTRALKDFKAGDVRVLVATDIAARGLDIDQLPHVVNFELPNIPEDYVHRIGRTGRAGREGQAISLVCAEERDYLRDIERLLRQSLPREELPGYEPSQSLESAGGARRPAQAARPAGRRPGNSQRRRRPGSGNVSSANRRRR